MEDILKELRYLDRFFPKEAVEKALQNQKELTPLLLEELDQLATNKEKQEMVATSHYQLHVYSLFLLAAFKEKKAFKKILAYISIGDQLLESHLADILTENLKDILYSTFDGDIKALESVIENPAVYIYARGAALAAYGQLFADGVIDKDHCITFLRKILAASSDIYSDLSNDVVSVILDYKLAEMKEDVQQLYDEERISLMWIGPYDQFIDAFYEHSKYSPVNVIKDVTTEMSNWACFERTPEQLKIDIEKQKEFKEMLAAESNAKKLGRNDPCFCGSGKKYKKCCLNKKTENDWLKYYPSINEPHVEGSVQLTDHYDDEAIAIDQLIYLAIKQRKSHAHEAEKNGLEAYQRFLDKCLAENIQSFESYDKEHKIHYRSKEWLSELHSIVAHASNQSDKLMQIRETLKALS